MSNQMMAHPILISNNSYNYNTFINDKNDNLVKLNGTSGE